MQKEQFLEIFKGLAELTFEQRNFLMKWLGEGDPVHRIRVLLEGSITKCPHCDSDDFGKWGKSHGLPRYRCRRCAKTFNPLTGTPLARLRMKDRWLDFIETLLNGESVRKSAKLCRVHKSTTFRWRHRFLKLPAEKKPESLGGIVEADETFLLHSCKGQRKLDRPARKRGGKAKKPGRSDEHACILVARDRAGNTVDHVSQGFDKEVIAKVLLPVLAKDAALCSDGLSSYNAFCRENGVSHRALNLSAGVRVVDDVFHIQNVNNYHGRFKEWLLRFHGVATSYLPSYLGWFRWLDQNRSSGSVKGLFTLAAGVNQHATVT